MYINFWHPIVRSEDLGYDQPEKDTTFAIPSPACRTTGNWVLDKITRIGNRIDRKASAEQPSVQAVG